MIMIMGTKTNPIAYGITARNAVRAFLTFVRDKNAAYSKRGATLRNPFSNMVFVHNVPF
jgi:hypothetical protein